MIALSGQDVFLVGFLAFLEGILSIDNAIVLALMARHLPREQQRKALTYGLVGAVGFRLIALGLVSRLMHWRWIKFVGGAYLIWVAASHLFRRKDPSARHPREGHGFWKTVLLIEVMDIAFAVDSILAAVAVSSKFWIVFTGGFIGVVLMRIAASVFLAILRRFPRFETTAYLLILLIGAKLIVDGFHFEGVEFEHPGSPGFIGFWSLMGVTLLSGFLPERGAKTGARSPRVT